MTSLTLYGESLLQRYRGSSSFLYHGNDNCEYYIPPLTLSAEMFESPNLAAVASAVAAGTGTVTVRLERHSCSIVANAQFVGAQLPARVEHELNSVAFAHVCQFVALTVWRMANCKDFRFLLSISDAEEAMLLRNVAFSGGVHVALAVHEFPADVDESFGRRFVATAASCAKALLGESAGIVSVSFHSPRSPFYLEAATRLAEKRASINAGMERLCADGMFGTPYKVAIGECDQRAQIDELYADSPLHTVTAFRALRPLLLLRGPTEAAVAAMRESIVSKLLERYPFDDLLPVEKRAHEFTLNMRGTLENATELRLINCEFCAIDADTATLLRAAVRNCSQLQCVGLADSRGLSEEDVLEILASPSVRVVSIDGLPFADKLRASTNGFKCASKFGPPDDASLRYGAYWLESSLFIDVVAPAEFEPWYAEYECDNVNFK
jgi:hypothetical protein